MPSVGAGEMVVGRQFLERDGNGGTRLIGPAKAALPVGVDFIARPFDEAILIRVASAFEGAARHRKPPPDFGPVPGQP